jgi:uncharacterized coiled-coil protein SlyX
MNCKFCSQPVEEKPGGHRPREYCSGAHRQAYFRQQHQADQNVAFLAELEQLRTQVQEQAQEIDELSSQMTDLRERLDIERRYLSDITPRYFKGWLKKQPTSPLVTQMLADPLFPPRGPRSLYEAHVRAHYGPVERDDFVRLWKLMLLSQG